VFIDESGLLMAPLVRRTWAPRGRTPIFKQKTRAHDKVTIVGSLCVSPVRHKVGLYFSLRCDENLNQDWLIDFLKDLKRHVRGRVILVWDRLAVHRGKAVRTFIEKSRRIDVELLPPYAPELNPVEGLWSHLKLNPLANWAPETSGQLFLEAVAQIEKLERRQNLLRSFVLRTPLSSCLG
jgi:transposase